MTDVRTDAAAELFAGPGEMRALARAFDWASTPLGPVSSWSQSLRTTAGIVMESRNPMFLFWGPELVNLYNDGFLPILGEKHPAAMGQRAEECWSEAWPIVEGTSLISVVKDGSMSARGNA